ncbi:coiled-coil domain-containing protein 126 [Clupea harengus]|uniref:Coiled-coil domain-containing protein 126 n=1 Tax=Clupea harengus TaxID=7950 RepID=A0A6P3W557_CLUHA|nr:coiled-coil domain-containing protein 126 [Clupea harengus]XP_042566560.1 coiled-coil domain-containing protein 126 [Clupea harengus]
MRAMLCVARRNMSQKLSVFLVLLGFCWGLLLLHYTLSRPHHQSSAQLRQQILDLSRRYVKALSEESQDPSGLQGTSMAGYADLKRTIAVLLDDILTRLVKLEGLVDTAVNASAVNTSHAVGGALLSPPATLQRLLKKDISLHQLQVAAQTKTEAAAAKHQSHTPHRPRTRSRD